MRVIRNGTIAVFKSWDVHFFKEQLATITTMRDAGCSYQEIARAVGGTVAGIQGTLWRLRRDGGVS